jgi:hypothetical protein
MINHGPLKFDKYLMIIMRLSKNKFQKQKMVLGSSDFTLQINILFSDIQTTVTNIITWLRLRNNFAIQNYQNSI